MADEPIANPQSTGVSPSTSPLAQQKKIVLLVGCLVIVFLIIGGILLWVRSRRKLSNLGDRPPIENSTMVATSTAGQPDRINNDQDRDGIPDAEEAKLGLSNRDFDTDHDGLSDIDEIIIWKTDPKNPDTDGDGFGDGVEVLRGYNPLGPGKLADKK
ncbi:MAG: hypothetical protein HY984_01635 [Candidatus Magasanikbacteria bacterium]|nr:hypothetical protein [Candidatus Magasanikbacteria bacterium]